MYTAAEFCRLVAPAAGNPYPLTRAAFYTEPCPVEFTETGVYAVATNQDVYYPFAAPDGTARAAAQGVEDLLRRHGAEVTESGTLTF